MKENERKNDNRKKKRAKDEPGYLAKNAEQMKKQRDKKQIDSESRIRTFRESVRYGRSFECICCHRKLFDNQVKKIQNADDYKVEMGIKYPGLFENSIGKFETSKFESNGSNTFRVNTNSEAEGNYHICQTCNTNLKKGKTPPMSNQNNLQVFDTKDYPELQLTEVENNLIALNLIFQKIYQLPKSRSPAMKDKTINIPIYEADVMKTVEALPRTPSEAGIIPVKLKRKLEYKNSHKVEYVSVEKVIKALKTL